MSSNNYYNFKGLLNGKEPNRRMDTDENTMLFTNIFQILTKWGNPALTEQQHHFMNLMKVDKWHKNVLPDELPTSRQKDLYLSRDQMFSYSVFAKLKGRDDHKVIWEQIWKHAFTYDNVSKGFNLKRIVMPWDWIFLGFLCGNPICWLLMPIYYLKGIHTFMFGGKTGTSGEQLFFHNFAADDHPLSTFFYGFYVWLLKRRFDSSTPWTRVFEVYYGNEHPIYKVVEKEHI